jgi:hypothetical protein
MRPTSRIACNSKPPAKKQQHGNEYRVLVSLDGASQGLGFQNGGVALYTGRYTNRSHTVALLLLFLRLVLLLLFCCTWRLNLRARTPTYTKAPPAAPPQLHRHPSQRLRPS